MRQLFSTFLVIAIAALSNNFLKLAKSQSRIISGEPAVAHQFPWQVIIKKDAEYGLQCGGSIIAANWVLSSAHCVYGLSSVYLMFGTIHLYDPVAFSMNSTELYINPNYNGRFKFHYDVSLIKLPTSLKFTPNIQPIKLAPSSMSKENFHGVTAVIAGYGYTNDEYLDESLHLLYARVTIINTLICQSVYGAFNMLDSNLCARGYNGTNASICTGDSGGPLITEISNGEFIQIGINDSVAADRCTEGIPSVYERVTDYLDYFTEITGISFNSTQI